MCVGNPCPCFDCSSCVPSDVCPVPAVVVSQEARISFCQLYDLMFRTLSHAHPHQERHVPLICHLPHRGSVLGMWKKGAAESLDLLVFCTLQPMVPCPFAPWLSSQGSVFLHYFMFAGSQPCRLRCLGPQNLLVSLNYCTVLLLLSR